MPDLGQPPAQSVTLASVPPVVSLSNLTHPASLAGSGIVANAVNRAVSQPPSTGLEWCLWGAQLALGVLAVVVPALTAIKA